MRTVTMGTVKCSPDINPDVLVTEFCEGASAVGEPITFNGVVTNTGNVELAGVTVDDDVTLFCPLD